MFGGLKGSEGMEKVLFALLRAAVCGAPVSNEIKAACTPEMLDAVYTLAERHDLAHLVGQGASKLDLPECEVVKKCKNAAMVAFYRYAQIQYEYQRICDLLETEKIPFIPLKGSVLRDYYPEPWMRTSCDIDILVPEETLETAANALAESLGYNRRKKTGHDISLFSVSGVHLELHYAAMEEEQLPDTQKVLDGIWDDVKPLAGKTYWQVMSDEMFYFYHVSHMAKHLECGGCGIRPVLDLWLLNHRLDYNTEKRVNLLAQGGMLAFAEAMEKLANVWFSCRQADVLTEKLGVFVLGKLYAESRSVAVVQQTKQGNKIKFILSRLFLPYSTMKFRYPILQKYKWLTPAYQVVRWLQMICKGTTGKYWQELKTATTISPEEIKTTRDMLDYLGL